jgi:hypothetical protein
MGKRATWWLCCFTGVFLGAKSAISVAEPFTSPYGKYAIDFDPLSYGWNWGREFRPFINQGSTDEGQDTFSFADEYSGQLMVIWKPVAKVLLGTGGKLEIPEMDALLQVTAAELVEPYRRRGDPIELLFQMPASNIIIDGQNGRQSGIQIRVGNKTSRNILTSVAKYAVLRCRDRLFLFIFGNVLDVDPQTADGIQAYEKKNGKEWFLHRRQNMDEFYSRFLRSFKYSDGACND